MSSLVFPLDIAGALPNLRRKPMFSTGILTTASGMELRAAWQSFPRYKYTLSVEMLRSDSVNAEFQRVATAFCGMLGQYDTFLIVDPNDSVVSNMGFGVTDGSSTAYQLQRTLGGVQQIGYWDPVVYPINTLSRSNLILQSETFDNATWAKSNATIGANVFKAPNGSVVGDALIESGATSVQHSVSQTVSTSIPATAAYFTLSVYVRPVARGMCILQMKETFANTTTSVWFNLISGKAGTIAPGMNWSNVTASILDAGAGWFRVSVTAQKTNSATGILSTLSSAAVDGIVSYAGLATTVACDFWGAQLEQGTFASQYLATLTIPVRDDPAYWPKFGDGFEPVTEVNTGTLQIFLNGTPKVLGVDYAYNGAGLINFMSTPASGQPLTWSGNYFRRVRFAADDLELERIFGQLWAGKTIEFISVK